MKTIGVMLLVMSLGCGCSDKQTRTTAMMATNDASVPYCVGRNVIDMPRSFNPGSVTTGIFRAKGLSVQEPAIDVIVHSTGLTLPQFAAEVARRRAELTHETSASVDVLRFAKR